MPLAWAGFKASSVPELQPTNKSALAVKWFAVNRPKAEASVTGSNEAFARRRAASIHQADFTGKFKPVNRLTANAG